MCMFLLTFFQYTTKRVRLDVEVLTVLNRLEI